MLYQKEELIMAKEKVCSIHGHCPKCCGMNMLVLGILIILNAYYGWLTWWYFLGGIIALKGLLKMLMPVCPHCK